VTTPVPAGGDAAIVSFVLFGGAGRPVAGRLALPPDLGPSGGGHVYDLLRRPRGRPVAARLTSALVLATVEDDDRLRV
jgi:hypothetical protein